MKILLTEKQNKVVNMLVERNLLKEGEYSDEDIKQIINILASNNEDSINVVGAIVDGMSEEDLYKLYHISGVDDSVIQSFNIDELKKYYKYLKYLKVYYINIDLDLVGNINRLRVDPDNDADETKQMSKGFIPFLPVVRTCEWLKVTIDYTAGQNVDDTLKRILPNLNKIEQKDIWVDILAKKISIKQALTKMRNFYIKYAKKWNNVTYYTLNVFINDTLLKESTPLIEELLSFCKNGGVNLYYSNGEEEFALADYLNNLLRKIKK